MGRRKKSKIENAPKKEQLDNQEEDFQKAPHSFIFHRGHVGRNVKELASNMRLVMEPFTAKNLQARNKNVLKDFVNVAGVLHVTHFMIFTKSDVSVNMRLCRLPRGPTMTFKVHNYCLTRDVISSLKKPNLEQMQFLNAPLLVMNHFSGASMHVKLMSTMFQNMFPSINVQKVRLNDVRRCVLVNYDPETKLIDFRHYNIRVVPVGMGRSVKKLVQAKLPNLSKYSDISDYIARTGYSSESEAEVDGPHNEVILPQQIKSRGNIKSTKSAVRLTELGPRMTLQLIKIEEGICDGEVMFHEFVQKTPEELQAQKAMRQKKKKLKEVRRKQQEENVRKKEEEKEEHKEKSLAGIKRKEAEAAAETEGVENPELEVESDEDDDVEYFREEVGTNPDPDTFSFGKKRKGSSSSRSVPLKKKRTAHTGKKSAADDKSQGQTKKTGATIQEYLKKKKARKLKLKAKKLGKKKSKRK